MLIGGTLKNNKGINLPGVKVSAPALTEKDRQRPRRSAALGVDFVALSFVRSPEDVARGASAWPRGDGVAIPIIAKIEKPEAIERLEEIIDVADGIMVARGDLGVEMGAGEGAAHPEARHRADQRARQGRHHRDADAGVDDHATRGRRAPRPATWPTRCSTAPTRSCSRARRRRASIRSLAVRTMARIIEEIEDSARFKTRFDAATLDFATSANAIAKAAVVAARQMNADGDRLRHRVGRRGAPGLGVSARGAARGVHVAGRTSTGGWRSTGASSR